jgi:hypothetical protein
MALADINNLASDATFGVRVAASLVSTAIAIFNEAPSEVQTLTVTGTPTGGSFTLASLPGSVVSTLTGTLTNAAATVTGLSSTVGLFVGMAVTGTNVPAGATIASITSLTALTISANATGTGAQSLTFSGTPVASINFNHTAADVQATLSALANIGSGNVFCTGGSLPGTPVTITFCGSLGMMPQKLVTLGTNSLTGGSSPTAAVTRTTAGGGANSLNHTRRAALAQNVVRNASGYASQMILGVAADATVQSDYAANKIQSEVTDAHIASAISGIWNSYA